MILRRPRWFAAVACVLGVALWSFPAFADVDDDIERIGAEASELGAELEGLEARYINPKLLEYEYEIQTRLNDGLFLYLEAKYDKASIIFLDLVSNDRIKGTPAQRDALYYLADSLFMDKNFIGSRRHFNDLLSIGAGEYYQDAVKRLIEIASVTNDFDNVESLYKAARSRAGNRPSPDLVYAYGKSLFFQGQMDEAINVFRQIPSDAEIHVQSLYFQGVIQAQMGSKGGDEGRLRKALQTFAKVLETIGPKPSQAELYDLVELAHLSLGRVYYELGEYELAVDQYQYIERTSARFDRALYEVTWTFIRRGDLTKALQHLDILLLVAPNSALAPEARLLRGDLMLESEDYGEAVATYQQVIDDYEPVRAQLKGILGKDGGAKAYFDALVGRPVSGARSVEVPTIVEAWVDEDPKMARTLDVARDLDGSRQDIDESLEIIRELEDAINSRSKVDLFPELKEGWGRGLEVQARFITFKRQLLGMEAKMVLAVASGDEKARYKAARDERAKLQKAYELIPSSRAELAARERLVKTEYNNLETRVYRLGVELDSMRAQLVAMDKYMRDTKSQGSEMTAEDEATIRETMDQLVEAIELLETEREELRRMVRRSKTQTGINDDVAEQEEFIKKEYQAALAREREVLRSMRGKLGGADARRAASIDDIHARLLRSEARLETYFSKLNKIVTRKVKEIRRLIDVEKVRVAQYVDELDVYSGDSESLAGDIAMNNFQRVDEKFNELILKADVGIIDVAWKRKEDRSNRIKELFEHQSNDLKTLDQNFRGVLEDEQ